MVILKITSRTKKFNQVDKNLQLILENNFKNLKEDGNSVALKHSKVLHCFEAQASSRLAHFWKIRNFIFVFKIILAFCSVVGCHTDRFMTPNRIRTFFGIWLFSLKWNTMSRINSQWSNKSELHFYTSKASYYKKMLKMRFCRFEIFRIFCSGHFLAFYFVSELREDESRRSFWEIRQNFVADRQQLNQWKKSGAGWRSLKDGWLGWGTTA